MGLLSDILISKVHNRHSDEVEARKNRIQVNLGIAHSNFPLDPDPQKDASLRQYYADLATKDMHPEAKKAYQRGVPLMNFFHNVLGHKDPAGYTDNAGMSDTIGSLKSISPAPQASPAAPSPSAALASPIAQPAAGSPAPEQGNAFTDKAPVAAGPSGSDANLGAAPNGPINPIPPPEMPATPSVAPPSAAPGAAKVVAAQENPPTTFDPSQANPYSSFNPVTQQHILQAERKKQAEQIGLKPGTRDYSQYVLLGQLPAVRANTALQRHELRVENWKTKIDPDTGDYYTDDKANQKAAEQELAVKSSDIQVHMNDGSVVPGIEDINGNKTRLDGTPFTKDELKNATGVFRNSSAAPRISPSEILTVDAAQSELEQGHQLNIIDPQGKPMTLAEVKGMKKQDPNLVLQYVHANNQTYLTPRSNRASEIVFNGKQYIVNPIEMQKGVREGSEIMGQGTPPTGEQTGVVTGGVPNALAGTNAQNMPATQSVVNGQIITHPASRKSSRSGFAQFGGANAQSIGEAAPLQAPAAPRNGASSQKPASTSSVGNDPAKIYAAGQTAPVPISQMSNAIKVATPIREYTTQIYGQRGLSNFSDLFKDGDKASIDRVGKVMRLVMKPLVDKDKGDSISAGGGGFHLSLGGLGNILAVKLGIPQKDAETQQQMIADQYRSLSQRERDYVDMVMSSLSTIQGARGAIGGNATDRTVAAIEKDVPIWGYNTWDRHEFNNKLLSLEKVAREAQVNRPVGLFNFQEIQDWHQKHFNPDGSDKATSGGSQPTSKNKLNAPAPGGVLSPAGREYLQNLNK